MDTSPHSRVVVGAADTLAGYEAMRYAVAEARRRSATVVVVRAFCYSRYSVVGHLEAVEYDAALQIASNCISAALGCPPRDVGMRVDVCEGPPAVVLARVADRPDDVIVIGGSSERRGIGRRRGTVAAGCSRRATCPVVIVPGPEMARHGSPASLARRTARQAERFAQRG